MKKRNIIRQLVDADCNTGQKLTLTNLFKSELEKGQSMFVNSKMRPHTMQNTRRNYLIKSSSGRKIQTHQNYRKQSEQITKSPPKIQVKIQQEDKIKIKKIYGRMNILADGFQMEENQKLSVIFQFLQYLAQYNNHHQKAFTYIITQFNQFVYAIPNQLLERYSKLTNNLFLSKFINRKIKCTYKDLCQQIISESLDQINSKLKKQQEEDQTLQRLTEELSDANSRVCNIKQELIYYKQHPSQNLYPYVEQLQNKIIQQKKIINDMEKKQLESDTYVDMLKHTNIILGQKIEELNSRIYQLQIAKLSNMKDVQKHSQLKQFEDNVDLLKTMLHKSVLRMEGVKEQYDKLKSYNQNLINQRSQLAKRAAVGFQQLTPRPKFKEIFKQSELNFEKIIPQQSSTQNIVHFLVKICKQLFQQKQKQTLKIGSTFFLKEKIIKTQIQPEDAINNITTAQQHVNITAQLANQVKKAYNKQKAQRIALQIAHKK